MFAVVVCVAVAVAVDVVVADGYPTFRMLAIARAAASGFCGGGGAGNPYEWVVFGESRFGGMLRVGAGNPHEWVVFGESRFRRREGDGDDDCAAGEVEGDGEGEGESESPTPPNTMHAGTCL